MNYLENTAIGGEYRHFKGKYYDVYCLALDERDNVFVLYRQMYGDRGFWLRPYEMFFGEKEAEGVKVRRFLPTEAERRDAKSRIEELLSIMEAGSIYPKNSETEQPYSFSEISPDRDYVRVKAPD